MTSDDVELAITVTRDWLTTLPQEAAQPKVTRDMPSKGEVFMDISPRSHPDAASIWILLPGESRNITFGAGRDYRY